MPTSVASDLRSHSRSETADEGWLQAEWTRFALRLGISGVAHPIEHAKVLIQLGYEPLEPYDSYTLLGTPAKALPNVLQYVAYLRREYGIGHCYAGVTPKLGCSVVSALVFTHTARHLCEEEDLKAAEATEERRRRAFFRRLTRDAAARMVALVLSHPLHVIAIRIMAQTVGGETRYSGFTAPVAVYRDSGLGGFFQGLAPRMVGELLALCISSLLTLAINCYLVDDRDARFWLSAAASYVASALTYPFHVVTSCMVVSGSGLTASDEDHMPYYSHWWQCWADLWNGSQLTRGSGLFWRFAPPTTAAALVPKIPDRRRRFLFFRRKTAKEEL